MGSQKIHGCEVLTFLRASINITSALYAAARTPVLLSNLIFKGFLALVAIEISVVEGLNDITMDLFFKIIVSPAARTRIIRLNPLANAGCTTELIALLTLLRVFHNKHADSAAEILFHFINCVFRCELLRGVYAIRNFSLEQI